VQYGGGKELDTLPHSTPGLVHLAVVVWGVLCMGIWACGPACAGICVHECVRMHIWCWHCMRIQPAFKLITAHTYKGRRDSSSS